MRVIRLRASDLDQWVRFIEPEPDGYEISLAQFMASMRRQVPATPQMNAGSAFHKVLELASDGAEIDAQIVDGFEFSFPGHLTLALPAYRELPVEKLYQTPSGPVLLRGRVDGEEDISVTDYKLTFGSLDVEKYAGSLQWMAYLDMMPGKRRFDYHVFTAYMNKKCTEVEVKEHHPFTFWAFLGMHAIVYRRVCELAEFVSMHVPELVMEMDVEGEAA